MWVRLVLALLWAVYAVPALAQERLALVIGNQDYPAEVGRLSNTHEDAKRVAVALEKVGFDVTLLMDQDRAGTSAAIMAYQGSLLKNPGAIGFFYYSGHGASADLPGQGRRNYLIPAREPVTAAEQLPFLGVRLDEIVDALSVTGAKALFLVSDACRNTLPFASENKGGPDGNKGFVRVKSPAGMLIAFATAEDATAPDDGAFSTALSVEIAKPGQDASLAFLRALQEVATHRDAGRLPFFTPGTIARDVCFASCEKGIDPGDAATWTEIRSDCEAEVYLAAYPNGAYSVAASIRVRRCHQAIEFREAGSIENLEEELAAIDYASPGFRSRPTALDMEKRYGREALDALANEGNPNAQVLLADLLREGEIFAKDKRRNLQLLMSACEAKHVGGCSNLGIAFEYGDGVEEDLGKAATYYRYACGGGLVAACSNLGRMYAYGRGIDKDEFEAVRLFRLACDGGGMRGCVRLGEMYEYGHGVPKDIGSAVRFYQMACESESVIECERLGWMYQSGQGVDRETVLAVAYYRRSVEH